MRFLASFLTALSLCAAALPAAHAQDDTLANRQQAAQALMQAMQPVMDPEKMIASFAPVVRQQLAASLQGKAELTAAQRDRAVDVMSAEIIAVQKDAMRELMPVVVNAAVQMYAERFSLAEIQQIQAFYASDVGRKALLVASNDLPRLMAPMMDKMKELGPRLQPRMAAAMQQLRSEGIDLK